MELAQELYVAENIKDLETIVYALRRNIPVIRLYCIVFIDKKNRMEIISSKELFTGRFSKEQGKIVGVAHGKWEATDLFCTMVEEIAKEGRDLTNPKAWIEENEDEMVL